MKPSKPSDEHERRWAEALAELGAETADDSAESIYGNPLPGMEEYREEAEARQAEDDTEAATAKK